MTQLWDNLHERRSKSKDLKARYFKSPFGNKKPSLIAIFMGLLTNVLIVSRRGMTDSY